ncbi:hypothetical protein [Streptomyces sp. NPDC057616]|uniref:hypothetical protein n=1 Tax=Streptomyces sp. NPDC057616 TaxID=3346183 RepID=UPI0036BFABB3
MRPWISTTSRRSRPGRDRAFVRRLILAAAATLIARRPGRPPRLILLLPGFLTLTVGSLGMGGLTTLAGGYVIEGFADLMKLVTIVTAIALGLVAGAALTQNLGTGGPALVPATTPPDEPVHEATP